MRHLVTVALRRATAPSPSRPKAPPRRTDTASVLKLQGTSAGRVYTFTATAGCVVTAEASDTDEHFAADADACRERDWLSCADVLYASRVRPSAAAVCWLLGITAAFPGCRLAAAPLAEGGWAVLDSASRGAVFVALDVPGDQPLLASCLYTWLVTGHDVRVLQNLRVVHGT
jgi:hypothetical protein